MKKEKKSFQDNVITLTLSITFLTLLFGFMYLIIFRLDSEITAEILYSVIFVVLLYLVTKIFN